MKIPWPWIVSPISVACAIRFRVAFAIMIGAVDSRILVQPVGLVSSLQMLVQKRVMIHVTRSKRKSLYSSNEERGIKFPSQRLALLGGGPRIGGLGLSLGFIINIGACFNISGTRMNRIIEPRTNT